MDEQKTKTIKCEPCNGTGFTDEPNRPEMPKSYCAKCGGRGHVTVIETADPPEGSGN